jgi:hypothetical protein
MSTVAPRPKDRRPASRTPPPRPIAAERTPIGNVWWIPPALTLGLFLISLTPRVQGHPVVARSFLGVTAALLAWQAVLYFVRPGRIRDFSVVLAPPRPQHYIQAMCHISVYVYWGWYWPPVYAYAWLLVAQIVFAYAFDMLLSWSRRGRFVLGFGPFPIIFSTNLFLWFRDDWFYLQFILVAVGFLGKEFVRWHREGRLVHVFNPSGFSLSLFSVALIATGTTSLTWGPEIASTLSLAPHIYVFLFAIGLVVMYFFSVTLVSASAAATLFGLSAMYRATTGVPYFLDSEIPSAVFLGLHLLVTDPSTSPRTPLGRLFFGVLYGLGVFGLYSLLGAMGAPTFYDKLMCVPLLNLSVPLIDRAVAAVGKRPILARLRLAGPLGTGNLAHIGAWAVFFAIMTAAGRTDGRHIGDSVPFWQQACAENRPNACRRLLQIERSYCDDNSGWACNELGTHYAEGRLAAEDRPAAIGFFSRGCELRFRAACVNLLDAREVSHAMPRVFDLRLLLREGGRNLIDMSEPELYARACQHGWTYACGRPQASN